MRLSKLSNGGKILLAVFLCCLALPFVNIDPNGSLGSVLQGLGIAAWVIFVLYISVSFYVLLRKMQN